MRSHLTSMLLALLVISAASPPTAEAACPPGFGGPSCNVCLGGYYGPSCLPCPGGPAIPCNGTGSCSDGMSGSGVCTCQAPYFGVDCQYALTSLTPTHGPQAGNTVVTVTGAGFGSAPGSVLLGGLPVASVVSWTNTQVKFVTAPGSAQSLAVTLRLVGGQSLTAPFTFSYDAPPVPSVGHLGVGALFASMLFIGAVGTARRGGRRRPAPGSRPSS
jgi:hypothetical protein